MTRRCFSARLTVAAIAVCLLGPGRCLALNPNHDCSNCHDLHQPRGSALLQHVVAETMCLTCHGPTGIAQRKADVHKGDGVTTRATCVDCHNSHDDMQNWMGGRNIKMIGRDLDGDGIAKVRIPNGQIWEVVFQSRGTDVSSPSLHSFADDNEDQMVSPRGHPFDGICETCHTITSHHRNTGDPSPHHAIGRTCTSCHAHEDGFAASGGSCLECHNTVQDNGDNVPPGGRRAVVGEFSLASHHADQVTDGDCVVCHDQSRHQQGRVRLFDVDRGLAIELTGDPATNATEAVKLEAFCLRCHDADGANGSAPFSDGQMPPVVQETVWNTGAHKTAGLLTCFGDGLSIGCHNTGHGSQKTRLLAPHDVGPGANNVNQEEGFCFNCHDGSVAPDAESDFTKAIAHPVNDSLQSPGWGVECVDCHNVHEAQGGAHDYNATADSTRNRVTPAIEGIDGVSVSYSGLGNFGAPALGAYTPVENPTLEYQICFKCHSGYAWLPGSPPNGLSPNGSVANPVQTDLAQEFNPANGSFHPIVVGLNDPNSNSSALQDTQLQPIWRPNRGSQTMLCTDCHNTDAAVPAAQGPHGSAVDFMLRGPKRLWPPTLPFKDYGKLFGQYATTFCSNCHTYTDQNIPHKRHEGRDSLYCYSCHIVIPHGGKLGRLMADRDSSMPARYAYGNDKNNIILTAFRKRDSYTGYQQGDCQASCSNKHSTHPGTLYDW